MHIRRQNLRIPCDRCGRMYYNRLPEACSDCGEALLDRMHPAMRAKARDLYSRRWLPARANHAAVFLFLDAVAGFFAFSAAAAGYGSVPVVAAICLVLPAMVAGYFVVKWRRREYNCRNSTLALIVAQPCALAGALAATAVVQILGV